MLVDKIVSRIKSMGFDISLPTLENKKGKEHSCKGISSCKGKGSSCKGKGKEKTKK